MLISVVIPTHNRAKLLKRCLESLSKQTFNKNQFEIIIADDYSLDETPNVVNHYKAIFPHLKYLRKIIPSGSYVNRNLGIRKAGSPIIVFLDDDCVTDKNWLKHIVLNFQKNPAIIGIEGKTTTLGSKMTPMTEQIINLNGQTFQTCNIAFRKKVLQEVGGFDEWYKVHCGDVDLALRVLTKGRIKFCPDVVVCHPPRPTTLKENLKKTRFVISELYFFLKFPQYFQQKYPGKNIFWQVVFVNSIWQRMFLVKYFRFWLKKDPWLYGRYVGQRLLEIGAIMLQIPQYWQVYRQYKHQPPT